DPVLLRGRRGKFFHELQAVAQAHLAQGDAAFRVNILNSCHARLPAAFAVDVISWASSSARTAMVSAPSAGTFSPSPILAPFPSIGNAGTRNGTPSAVVLLTRPPGRSTCGSLNRSSGRLIGEKQTLS